MDKDISIKRESLEAMRTTAKAEKINWSKNIPKYDEK